MKKGVLVILDGYGEGKDFEFNAETKANTPFLDELHKLPYSLLSASGEDVGLLNGVMGGSEVGHMTIGAGRVVSGSAKLIRDEILNGNFFAHKKLNKELEALKKREGDLHLIGLMSDKNVHSDINHAFAIIKMAHDKAKNIFLHLFTDGRDSAPYDSVKYLKKVKAEIKKYKNCEIASLCGRLYGMDREENWDRTKLAFDNMFGEGKTIKQSEVEAYLQAEHKAGKNDQFVLPVKIKTKADCKLKSKDVVLMFNFREDRVRQLARMINENTNCKLITMANATGAKSVVLYPPTLVKDGLGEYLSKLGLKQKRISESTKYAHLTYFFNGGREEPFPLEERVHIVSHKVADFSNTPKMRAEEITKEVIKAIKQDYDAIIVNYSNPDMLGHTGNFEATVKSLEFMDGCLKKLADVALKKGYFMLFTADHGNAEVMRYDNGEPHIAHTLNRVFCVPLDNQVYKVEKYGGLRDIAPTFVDLMGIRQNKRFEGKSLLKK